MYVGAWITSSLICGGAHALLGVDSRMSSVSIAQLVRLWAALLLSSFRVLDKSRRCIRVSNPVVCSAVFELCI